MKKLYTPSYEMLCSVPEAQFSNYLAEHSLTALGVGRSCYIVFKSTMAPDVEKALAGEFSTIKSYRDIDELRHRVSRMLASCKEVVVRAGTKMIRKHFTTAGFVSDMNNIADELPDVEVFIPAGRYGTCHLFGLRSNREDFQRALSRAS